MFRNVSYGYVSYGYVWTEKCLVTSFVFLPVHYTCEYSDQALISIKGKYRVLFRFEVVLCFLGCSLEIIRKTYSLVNIIL